MTDRSSQVSSGNRKKVRKIDPVKRKHRKMNQRMILTLMIVSAVTIVAFVFNIINVASRTSSSSSGTSTSLSSNTDRSMQNDLYEIGNNPTDFEKQCFQELTDAMKGTDQNAYATALVKCFVSDYFTWTNKDGNYEVGGLQYIFGEKYTTFEEWSRYNYYQDMDLYISQYGRENLPEVTSITTDVDTFQTDDYTINTIDPAKTYSCYQVQVSWTYNMGSKLNPSDFVNDMRFLVVDNDGRMEIAEFYDMNSVNAWEAANGTSSSAEAPAGTEG
jgi:hypothetical protein